MAKRQVGLKLEEELLSRADARAEELGVSRTELVERALRFSLSRPSGEVVEPPREPVGEAKPEGRKLDPYPSAPRDPEARADWTGARVAGWAPFGVPARVKNAELIAQQQKKDGRS